MSGCFNAYDILSKIPPARKKLKGERCLKSAWLFVFGRWLGSRAL